MDIYLGRPFLKKYQLVFDGTKKLVGYYNKNQITSNINESNTNSKSNKIIIVFIIVNIILIPIVFFFARRIYMKRKYKANELDSYFVENNNKDKNDNENENSMNIEIGLIK